MTPSNANSPSAGERKTLSDKTCLNSKATGPIRVMIVDDSLTVRIIYRRIIECDSSLRIDATASSAEKAIIELKSTSVDVIILDLEMPGIGGLKGLPEILKVAGSAQVLVVSSLTDEGAEATVAALSMGAADTMLKPRPGAFDEEYRASLIKKIKVLSNSDENTSVVGVEAQRNLPTNARAKNAAPPEVLAIGASTGGIHAINNFLRVLPKEFNLPILVTQHLPPSFVSVFARQIETVCGRPTQVGEHGTQFLPGSVTIATGHSHMLIHKIGDRLFARKGTDPVPNGCMPSVDPMLSSLAETCGDRVLAIILSGMGRDGLIGAHDVVEAGGTVFAQDADSSAVWGMPGAVAKAGLASLIASPDRLSEAAFGLQAAHVY
ncbi:MAG: chemotaxis-specific protein-glutamate methyltransferase CheB [Erythrobacter sp.]